MTIGELAKALGVNVETIRYYQRRGLIGAPAKPAFGRRKYSEATAARVGFIRRAQQLGFSLAEVESLLELEHGRNCRDVRLMAERKRADLESRVAELERTLVELRALIGDCKKNRKRAFCPMIAALLSGGLRPKLFVE
jgi:MerR family mercuric resistance operon transcriptional regulator